jgi:hypothetical protein
MNWVAVGAIAETFRVLAVIVSLIYVAVRIRQNTKEVSRSVQATELAAFERNIESGNAIRELLIVHPALARLFRKGMHSFSGLDPSERFRFGLLLRNTFSSTQGAYIREITVRHDPDGAEGMGSVVDSLLVNRGAREWLEQSEPDWRPEFREFVAERLAAVQQEAGHSPTVGEKRGA